MLIAFALSLCASQWLGPLHIHDGPREGIAAWIHCFLMYLLPDGRKGYWNQEVKNAAQQKEISKLNDQRTTHKKAIDFEPKPRRRPPTRPRWKPKQKRMRQSPRLAVYYWIRACRQSSRQSPRFAVYWIRACRQSLRQSPRFAVKDAGIHCAIAFSVPRNESNPFFAVYFCPKSGMADISNELRRIFDIMQRDSAFLSLFCICLTRKIF